MSALPADLRASAMPTCGKDGCDQPWLRVEYRGEITPGGSLLRAASICEFGHRVPIEPLDPRDSGA